MCPQASSDATVHSSMWVQISEHYHWEEAAGDILNGADTWRYRTDAVKSIRIENYMRCSHVNVYGVRQAVPVCAWFPNKEETCRRTQCANPFMQRLSTFMQGWRRQRSSSAPEAQFWKELVVQGLLWTTDNTSVVVVVVVKSKVTWK